jgi:hypothetical protein
VPFSVPTTPANSSKMKAARCGIRTSGNAHTRIHSTLALIVY